MISLRYYGERDSRTMSALNIIIQRDRVVLVTDGAVWDVKAG
jgi:hypothetical protein